MPNRRQTSGSRRHGSFFGSLFGEGHNRREGQNRRNDERNFSNRNRDNSQDQYYGDYQGRSPRSNDYQFDADPGSFDSDRSDRTDRNQNNRWQGRASASDMGYNYQGSTHESYWNPRNQDVNQGSESRGINEGTSDWGQWRDRDHDREQRDTGSANSPGSYQGHGIDVGQNYSPYEGRGYGSSQSYQGSNANYGSYQGSGSGYEGGMGSSGSGYGSYEGTAGSNYGRYESTGSPQRRSWGSTEDWSNHQSARQSMGSGYGSYQGSSQDSSRGFEGPTQGFQQRPNPGFQETRTNTFSQSSLPIGRDSGVGAQDLYENLNTGFSGPFREDRPSSRGTHWGKGPKGYRRSDERIKDDVCYALMMAPDVDASHIEVDVKEGVVTLKGTVTERSMKRMAEDCMDNIQGVTDVHNQLKVQSPNESSSFANESQNLVNNTGTMSTSSRAGEADFTQDSKSKSSSKKS